MTLPEGAPDSEQPDPVKEIIAEHEAQHEILYPLLLVGVLVLFVVVVFSINLVYPSP